MRVVLIMSNHRKQGYPPMGVLYLAAYLRKYQPETDIRIYDVFPPTEELLENPADLIGFSCMSIQFNSAFKYATELRKKYTGKIVVGGVHITLTKELPQWADYGIIGEGEQTLSELVEYLDCSNKDISEIKGLAYRSGTQIIINNERELIEDLDSIPFPAWDMIDMEPYLRNNNVYGTVIGRGMSLMTSRGCVYHCEFCAASKIWKKIRFHSAKYVVDMMEYVINKYHVEHLWIADDHFALKKERLYEISELMKERNIQIGLGISCRVESYDSEMAAILKSLGVKALGLGLETGSERMLKKIKNGIRVSVEEEKQIINQMVQDGFEVHGMFMINMPGETLEDLEKTIKFIHELPLCKISVSVAMPYYGTGWWEIAVAQGVVPPHPERTIWDAANMKKFEANRLIFKTGIPLETLKKTYDELTDYGRTLFYFDWENR